MNRCDEQRQGAPASVERDFPSLTPGPGQWFRAFTWRDGEPDGGCWYYASVPATDGGPGGRFDLRHPDGTCYWASSELAAARERLGRPGSVVAHDEVDGVRVAHAIVDPGRVADLLHRDAALHGVTQELSASVPYVLSQQWAAAFHAAAFGGVRYQPRFTTERAQTLASFGPAGRPAPDRSVAASLEAADVLRDNGCTVLTEPHSREVTVLPD